MTNANRALADEAMGHVTIRAEEGLDPLLARQIRDWAKSYGCVATLESGVGVIADAGNILELLLLCAPKGARVKVHCVGPGAHAAYSGIVGALAARGGVP